MNQLNSRPRYTLLAIVVVLALGLFVSRNKSRTLVSSIDPQIETQIETQDSVSGSTSSAVTSKATSAETSAPTSMKTSILSSAPSATGACGIPEASKPDASCTTSLDANTGASTQSESKRLRELLPKLKDVREEIAADPHSTPSSLIDFALELGRRVDQAELSETASKALYEELEDCVSRPKGETVPSAQAMCLIKARTLSAKYSSLNSRFARLQEKAPVDVRDLTSMLK